MKPSRFFLIVCTAAIAAQTPASAQTAPSSSPSSGSASATSGTLGSPVVGTGGSAGSAAASGIFDAISGMSTTQRTGSAALSPSNILGPYYANPYYQGRAGSAQNEAPGGFGQPLYGTTAATTGTGSQAGRQTAAAGFPATSTSSASSGSTTFGGQSGSPSGIAGSQSGMQGGRQSQTQRTASNTNANFNSGPAQFGSQASSAVVVPLPRPIAFTAQIGFKTAPPDPAKLLRELRAIVARSSALADPRGVEIAVDGGTAILRGSVRDGEEARLVEGMIRLAPGVRDVRSELRFPITAEVVGP